MSAVQLEVLPSAEAVVLPLAISSVYAESAADYNPWISLNPTEVEPGEEIVVTGDDFVRLVMVDPRTMQTRSHRLR